MFNKLIAAMLPFFPKKFVWLFSKPYIAGENIDDAVKAAKDLNSKGCMVTMDILGEFIKTLEEAEANTQEYIELIERIEKEGINGNYSVKPTMFGLLIDKDACYGYIRQIVAKAAEYNNFIRVDMEDSPCTDMTIEIFRKLKAEFPKNVGLVLQAYMKRTYQDIQDLMDINTEEVPVNYRLCKGIYIEPAEIAFKKYEEVNEHFLQDIDLCLKNGVYPSIATHDKPIVQGAYELLEKYNTPKEKYEFQMLYGVTPKLRQSIIEKGHRMRVYVPYGKQWFGYSTRRLKENPKMANHIMKAIFFKG
ncbi:MAG: proline dehydrogenase family protein [Bacteroidales bacterium]|nr:proline dehydrogenase family protein [Bacteroidales bacterium]